MNMLFHLRTMGCVRPVYLKIATTRFNKVFITLLILKSLLFRANLLGSLFTFVHKLEWDFFAFGMCDFPGAHFFV